jgi:GNAT superfamily N-acetyltransferase
MGTDLPGTEDPGIEKVLLRGTAEILERDDDGIFLFDTVGEAYMISSTDAEKAAQWILRHSDRDYRLFAVNGDPTADFIRENMGFKNMLKCRQLVYYGEINKLPQTPLTTRYAAEEDLDFILAHYDILSREELTKIITRRKLIMGLLNGKPVGFVGEHLEGSLGILYILPEYRKQGFAAYLEKYLMNEMLKDGYFPFGQVEVGNEKSLNLQKKLGFKECSGFVYWFF